jgi:hypothetical protein
VLVVQLNHYLKEWHHIDVIVKEDQIFVFISVDDWDNWYIELFENFPCNSKEELNKREGPSYSRNRNNK